MVNSLCQYAASVVRAIYDANGHQKIAKHKPKAQCDCDFETVRTHGVRSSILRENGNYYITEYLSDSGTIAAHYEYSPFGEIAVQTGSMATTFTHRFSTKPWCAVTGFSEYEYRKYSPALGRWLSRDPIGERGGPDVYVALKNSPINNTDLLGLMIPLRPPADDWKCNCAAVAMVLWSSSTPANSFLWNRWLSGKGGDEWVSYGWFDPLGIWRRAARQVVEHMLGYIEGMAASVPCNETRTYYESFQMSAMSSPNLMINVWQQTTQYYIFYGKKCENNCCKSLWAKTSIFNSAYDRTDFNPGDQFLAPPFLIEDQLINECFNTGNNDFDVKSITSEELDISWPCPSL